MLPVFICEDNNEQRSKLETIIRNYIMIEEYDMELVLSTNNPQHIIDYLTNQKVAQGIYFLDVDLGYEINGIQLGSYIRDKDTEGKIIFITTHSELLMLTFTYKVEALDYIIKDDTDSIKDRIHGALQQAQKHAQQGHSNGVKSINLKIGSQIRVFSLEDVMFIETSPTPHKLTLHLANSTIDFYGKINETESLAPSLVRVHKSYVINSDNIKSVDKIAREVTMLNGEVCLLSVRQLKKLEKVLLSE